MNDIQTIRKAPDDSRLEMYINLCKTYLEQINIDGLKLLVKHIFTVEFNDSFGSICIVQPFLTRALELIEDKEQSLEANLDLDDVPIVLKSIISSCHDCMRADEDIDLRNIIRTATYLLVTAQEGLEDFAAAAETRLSSSGMFTDPESLLRFILPAAPHTLKTNDEEYVTGAVAKLDSAAAAYLSQLVNANVAHADKSPLLLQTTASIVPLVEATKQYVDAADRHEQLSRVDAATLTSLDGSTAAYHRDQALRLLCLCLHSPSRQLVLEKLCSEHASRESPAFEFTDALRCGRVVSLELASRTKDLLSTFHNSEAKFNDVLLENTVRALSGLEDEVKIDKFASLIGQSHATTEAMLISVCTQRKYNISIDQIKETVLFNKSIGTSAHNPFSHFYKTQDDQISKFINTLVDSKNQ